MEKWTDIVLSIGSGLVIVIPVIFALLKAIVSNVRNLATAIKEGNWNKVVETLTLLITKAEQFTQYTGQEKKAFVLAEIELFMKNNDIDTVSISDISNEIENIINLTKIVNKREVLVEVDKEQAIKILVENGFTVKEPYNEIDEAIKVLAGLGYTIAEPLRHEAEVETASVEHAQTAPAVEAVPVVAPTQNEVHTNPSNTANYQRRF